MSTENTQSTEVTGGAGIESTGTDVNQTQNTLAADSAATDPSITKVDQKVSTNLLKEDKKQAAGKEAPVIPAYAPNYKYKAAMQEKELDAFWHPLIKDADSEKKVKDIFTKVDAFDYMKDKSDKRDKEYESLKTDFETQARIVQKVMTAKQGGDLDSVFRQIGLNDHDVIQWVAKKIDYLESLKQMSPEQRMQIEAQQKAVYQNEEYQDQITQMKHQMQVQATQARLLQLDMTLSKPEISSAATFWDEKIGYQGAFRDAVIEEAQKYWHQTYQQTGTGVDLTPDQATERVLKKYANFLNIQGSPQATTAQGTQGQITTPQASEKPVIPVIQGSSKTPIKKQIRSIEDIKKRAKELEAQQNGF